MAQLWDDKEMEGKTKKRYYKEVINPTLDNHNYLWVLSITKKKMSFRASKQLWKFMTKKTTKNSKLFYN